MNNVFKVFEAQYSRMLLKHGPIHLDIPYTIVMITRERKSNFWLTTDTPYLALTGELWGVYYENFEENWPRYNGTVLYQVNLNHMNFFSTFVKTERTNHLLK